MDQGWRFDNSYLQLPGMLYVRCAPRPVANPQLVLLNLPLAAELGLTFDPNGKEELASLFSGTTLPHGASPIAQAYAGHQYGYFTHLGDGRAILLGEHLTPTGCRVDIQLKGSGRTKFSRRGDGRAALGPMLREYVVSEAMHALGIPTTRSLAVVATGEPVIREKPLPGAILTRVAASHLRVGTFEFVADRGDVEVLAALATYALGRHFYELRSTPDEALTLLKEVIVRQAHLIAQWLGVGFVHGVMNTDNVSIAGETLDYGPCAFLDEYDPQAVFSSIDQHGRYSFSNQPRVCQWNLARFAESLLPLLAPDEGEAVEIATSAVQEFPQHFGLAWRRLLGTKLGFETHEESDAILAEQLLGWMARHRADFTNTFRALSFNDVDKVLAAAPADADVAGFKQWHSLWQARLQRQPTPLAKLYEGMLRTNPAVIPRNHLVHAALEDAVEHQDLSKLSNLLCALATPFDPHLDGSEWTKPPTEAERVRQTFCGT